MRAARNGDVSFWYSDIGGVPAPRPSLPGNAEADVAIVGAGYTGLWTAYYLLKRDPTLKIVLLERRFSGFGASGRNGGALSGGFAWSRERYVKTSGREAVIEMQAAMNATVEEIVRVAAHENIDADILRVEGLTVATNEAQLQRVRERAAEILAFEKDPDRVRLISADEVKRRIDVPGALGGAVTRGAARVQPAKLVRGLAQVVENLGAVIFEETTVTAISAGKVETDRGTVKARTVIRATEGFTAGLPGEHRNWLALNSAQIVTEPLPLSLWKQIGWLGNELLGNTAHAYCYAQRTREGRITMGGRGVPYRFGSATDVDGRTQQATIDQLHAVLKDLLPQAAELRIDHAWCGVLGVPRDWCTTVGLDPKTRIGWAGGYVGRGISTSNLAGRTLADLVLGERTDLTRLPWVDRSVRRWEPEPFRWLGVHAMYQLYSLADRREAKGLPRTSRLASFADRLTGH